MTLDRLPAWVSILAVLLLGYYLAKLVWLLYPVAESPPWLPPAMLQSTSPVAVSQSDYASIGAAHLFGEVSRDVPRNQQRCGTDGTGYRSEPATARNRYCRRSEVCPCHHCRQQWQRKSVLRRDASAGRGNAAENPARPGHTEPEPDNWRCCACRVPLAVAVPPLLRRHSSAPRFPAVQAEVEEFVAQNTAGFLEVVRPQPFMPNGQLKGYRIYPGPNRQQFAALGLRAGDLITEINGVVLNNPAQGTEVFRSLGGATQVTVTLERDGQPQVLSLNMDQVSPAGGATQ